MPQSAVKLLFASSHSALAADLEAWLQETAEQVQITGISLDSNEFGHCLAVLYDLGAGPVYTSRVWFHTQHWGLEEEANAELLKLSPAKCRLIAIGSNKYGHCLCVVAET